MWYYNIRHIRKRKCQLNIINYQRGGEAMKFFRKLGFQLVLFFIVAITIPIVMLMVSSITTTSSSMENNAVSYTHLMGGKTELVPVK